MKELTTKQEKAIAFVLSSRTIEAGLKKAKTSRTQFYKWMEDTEFAAVFEQRKKDIVQAAYDVLRNALQQAAGTLIALLKSKDEKIQRLTACNIIELYSKHSEISEIEKRLTVIESKLQ